MASLHFEEKLLYARVTMEPIKSQGHVGSDGLLMLWCLNVSSEAEKAVTMQRGTFLGYQRMRKVPGGEGTACVKTLK